MISLLEYDIIVSARNKNNPKDDDYSLWDVYKWRNGEIAIYYLENGQWGDNNYTWGDWFEIFRPHSTYDMMLEFINEGDGDVVFTIHIDANMPDCTNVDAKFKELLKDVEKFEKVMNYINNSINAYERGMDYDKSFTI